MSDDLSLRYDEIFAEYLETCNEGCLHGVVEFVRELVKLGIGPEAIVEMHLAAVKRLDRDKRVHLEKVIDQCFAFLMEGILAYGVAYKENLTARTEKYVAKIGQLNSKLSERLAQMETLYETIKSTNSSIDMDEVLHRSSPM